MEIKKFLKKEILILSLFFSGTAFFVFFGFDFFGGEENFKYTVPSLEIEDEQAEEVFIPSHIETPDFVRGIYMTSWVASTREWRANMVKMIKETELNSIIIDVKDYSGRVAFETSDPEIKKIGSEEIRINDAKEFLQSLHDKGIYAIARISVFQDPYMVKQRPDLAVKRKNGEVWEDYKGLAWLDPCSKEVWDYIIRIAKETEHVGFDELNFDYIRFPSDGNMKDIAYDFCAPEISKEDLMEEFFLYLSENLKDTGIPLSADLFGMVTVNTDDLNIGQVLEKTAPYFDFIAPMVYPSHYPTGYMGYKNPALYPYEIVLDGMNEASKRLIAASSTPSKLRPWLQDFDLGAEYDTEMIRKQKQAVYNAGLDSWMLWNASNKYTREALD